MRVWQSTPGLADTPPSRAGSLPQLICVGPKNLQTPQNPCGSELLAMRVWQSTPGLADTPPSRACSLPQLICVGPKNLKTPQNQCGSRLARDEGVAVNTWAG